jgi:hypothetical protein
MENSPQLASFYIPPSHVRAFGDDLAPPRMLYLGYFPAALVLVGVLSWIMSDESGLLIGSICATAIALYSLLDWLFRHAPTRFSTLLAMSSLLGYGVGTLNTWLTLPRGALTLGQAMGLSDGVLARGIAAVLLSSGLLYFLGELFEKPLFGQSFRVSIDETTRSLVYFGALCMIAGYATHSLIIGGAAVSEGHISIFGMFLDWLYCPITALAVTALLTARTNRQRLLAGVSSAVFLLMFAVRGRRISLYTTIGVLFVLGLSGYQWRGKGIRNVLLIASLGVVIVVCSLAFMLLRIAPITGNGRRQPTLYQRVQGANRLVKQGTALELSASATQANLQSRTFVLGFLANTLEMSSRMTPALGRDAMGLLESTIPSAIYPDKDRFFSEELLVDRQFGLSYGDEANSVLTAGATDFGLLGMIFYPVLMVLLARSVYEFIAYWLKPLPLLLVTLNMIILFLGTEEILSGYFADIRNELIFGIIIQIFISLPKFRLHSEPLDHLG